MYYLLLYNVVDDFVNRRTSFQNDHLKVVRQAHEHGDLMMAGALSEPVEGAALLFRANDKTVPERFAREDPYVKNGLVKEWRALSWNVGGGGEPDKAH